MMYRTEEERLNKLVTDLRTYFNNRDPEMAEKWTNQVEAILFSDDSELERIVTINEDKYNLDKPDVSINDNYVLSRKDDSTKQQKPKNFLAKIKSFFVIEKDLGFKNFIKTSLFVDELLERELDYRKLRNELLSISNNTYNSPDLKLERIQQCLHESDFNFGVIVSNFEVVLSNFNIYKTNGGWFSEFTEEFSDTMFDFARHTGDKYCKLISDQVQPVTNENINQVVDVICLYANYNVDMIAYALDPVPVYM